MPLSLPPPPTFARALRICSPALRWRLYSSAPRKDEYGIPHRPTWSVAELLSSYPKPSISSKTLTHLHELAALVPPTEGTTEHTTLKEEMSELITLVEAVKLVDTQDVSVTPRWHKEDADRANVKVPPKDIPEGQELLQHATRTKDGFYVVDADRTRRPA